MKHKIVGIVILMLVITTVVSAAYVNVKEQSRTTASVLDVPVWEKGDSWTYNEQYINQGYLSNGTLWNLWYHNCTSTYTVTDVTGDNYTVKMTSINNEGSQIINWKVINYFRMTYTPFTKLTGEFILKKTDLSYLRSSRTEKGFVFMFIGKIGLFLPGHFNMTWVETDAPSSIFFPFPLIAGTNGALANFSWDVQEIDTFFWGLIFTDDYFGYSGEQKYTCEMADLSVPAGTYDTYNVSIEYKGSLNEPTCICSYYAPEVGWFVKQSYNYTLDTGKPGYIYKCELVSTTYTP